MDVSLMDNGSEKKGREGGNKTENPGGERFENRGRGAAYRGHHDGQDCGGTRLVTASSNRTEQRHVPLPADVDAGASEGMADYPVVGHNCVGHT